MSHRFLLLWIGLVVAFTGCGRKPNLPPLAEVHGIFTFNGKPLQGGHFQFIPNRSTGTVGPPAVGNIGPDGRYELTTAGQKGALVGSHHIKIAGYFIASNPETPSVWIPKHYSESKNSGAKRVEVQVHAGKENEINIALTFQPAESS